MGLANVSSSLVELWSYSELTLGVTVSSRVRVHIDPAVCYLAVVSRHPGCAQAAKGEGVNLLKPFASWVKNGASQFGYYLLEVRIVCGKSAMSTRGTWHCSL